ncbi:MAG: DUF1192 domain-containing protein [Salaquimonas sp.]
MFDDLDNPKKKPSFEIGQNLEDMSVEELAETIEVLKDEIKRLDSTKNAKSAHLDAAAALFAKKG